ncbi:MAG: hypothetical protein ACOYN0_00120 [Phycisphaerales bacterium]
MPADEGPTCSRCGYDLSGQTAGESGGLTCPECGQADAAKREVSTADENDQVLLRAMGCVACGTGSFMVMRDSRVQGILACVLVGLTAAFAISVRRRSRGSNRLLGLVVFVFAFVYVGLFVAAACAFRFRR